MTYAAMTRLALRSAEASSVEQDIRREKSLCGLTEEDRIVVPDVSVSMDSTYIYIIHM